jgi:hypothetical protein
MRRSTRLVTSATWASSRRIGEYQPIHLRKPELPKKRSLAAIVRVSAIEEILGDLLAVDNSQACVWELHGA